MTTLPVRARRVGLILVFALFVALGLPEGTLGVAWPSMRQSFDQPVSALAASSLGAIVVSAAIGVGVRAAGLDTAPVILVLVTGGTLVAMRVTMAAAPRGAT